MVTFPFIVIGLIVRLAFVQLSLFVRQGSLGVMADNKANLNA